MKVKFRIVTAYHILRSVFGNTPGFCSSTKLAELSKPLTPSMALENPRNRRLENEVIPPVNWKFAKTFSFTSANGKIPFGRQIEIKEIIMRAPMVQRWNTNMLAATAPDSLMPIIFKMQKKMMRQMAVVIGVIAGTRVDK